MYGIGVSDTTTTQREGSFTVSAQGIFGTTSNVFTHYEGTIRVINRLTGGVPKDHRTMQKWIESRIEGGNEAALAELVNRTYPSNES